MAVKDGEKVPERTTAELAALIRQNAAQAVVIAYETIQKVQQANDRRLNTQSGTQGSGKPKGS